MLSLFAVKDRPRLRRRPFVKILQEVLRSDLGFANPTHSLCSVDDQDVACLSHSCSAENFAIFQNDFLQR